MYTEEELKKIKISIERPNFVPLDNNANEQFVDYSFSNEEKLPIHLNPCEGTKPLFNNEFANRIRTPSPERFSRLSDLSSLSSGSSRESEKCALETVLEKLDDMVNEVKGKAKEAKRKASAYKNKRLRSRSRNSSFSEDFNSPRRKRMRRDSEFSNRKYDHPSTSRYNVDDEEYIKNRYRDDRSRSSSSDSYLPRKLEKDISSLLNDSFLSNHSRSNNYKYSRNSKKYDSNYYRKSNKHKSEENYDDYYRNESYYHDMKERYARYYTVMYAFNIIMDILRKDDLYNNHY